MQHNLFNVVTLIACASITCSAASAGVQVTSRLSTVNESRLDNLMPVYDNSDSTTALGTWSTTLPRGYSHTSTVTDAGVSGIFSGAANATVTVDQRTSVTLAANFSVTGSSTTARILLSGHSAAAQLKNAQPEKINGYVAIYNADTNTVVFDSFDYATRFVDPASAATRLIWDNVSQDVVLGVGNYRLLIGATNQFITRNPVSSNAFSSSSLIDTSVTFIPAPGALAALSLAGIAAARRRRG